MKILKVDKDKVQVELTEQEVNDIAFSLVWGAAESSVQEDIDRLLTFQSEFEVLEEQIKK